jgi:hypothetical protein
MNKITKQVQNDYIHYHVGDGNIRSHLTINATVKHATLGFDTDEIHLSLNISLDQLSDIHRMLDEGIADSRMPRQPTIAETAINAEDYTSIDLHSKTIHDGGTDITTFSDGSRIHVTHSGKKWTS